MYAELIEKENSMDIEALRQLQAEHRSEIAEAERLHPGLVMPWENPTWATIAAAAPTHLADLITALEREQRIREIHKEVSRYDWFSRAVKPICTSCQALYPCQTIRILDGNE